MAKAKLQLTLRGMRKVEESPKPNGTIKIDLDDQDVLGGRAITYDVFQELVGNYCGQSGIKPEERVAYIIDKQLLHILLSSKECAGLMLAKCKRYPKKKGGAPIYSIAFMAVDKDGNPIGTKQVKSGGKLKNVLKDDNSDVPAGEWIQGITFREAQKKGVITPSEDREHNHVDVDALVGLIGNLGKDHGLI